MVAGTRLQWGTPRSAVPLGERGSVGRLSSRGWGSLEEVPGRALDGVSPFSNKLSCVFSGSVSCDL